MSKIHNCILILLIATFIACDYEVIPDETSLSGEPIACIGSLPKQCEVECTINYDASCSENATIFNWDFGDGNTSDEQQGAHTYQTAGTYTATLEVSNNSGTTSTNAVSIQVVENSSTPIADFSFDESITYYENCTAIQFINNSQNATSYLWEFGDGLTSSEKEPEHTFQNRGNYSLKLTAINENIINTATEDIYIEKSVSFNYNFGPSEEQNNVDLIHNEDGSLIVSGKRGDDIYISKLKRENADVEWTRSHSANNPVYSNSIEPNAENGYLIVGTTNNPNEQNSIYLLKLNSEGEFISDDYYGGNQNEGASSITTTHDGSFAVSGFRKNSQYDTWDALLLKVDNNGKQIWGQSYLTSTNSFALDLAQTESGEYLIVGYTNIENAPREIFVIKTDQFGNETWNKPFKGNDSFVGRKIIKAGNNFVILGDIEVNGYSKNILILEISKEGDLISKKEFGSNSSYEYSGRDIKYLPNEGFAIAGYVYIGRDFYFYLLKIDTNWDTVFEKEYEDGASHKIAYSIALTSDCGYVLAGSKRNDGFHILKTDSQGNIN